MYKNPTAELVRVKVDLLGYVNVTNEIELDDNTWGEMKREWLPPKPNALWDKSAMTRTAKYTINTKQWKIYKREVLDDDDIKKFSNTRRISTWYGGDKEINDIKAN